MKLYFSQTSPYARKVRVVAHETACSSLLELVPVDTWNPGDQLESANPLGKVPALVCGDGMVLYDSPVICEYLDFRFGSSRLLPAAGPRRWEALRMQALGDGLMDLAVERFVELHRRPALQDGAWLARAERKLRVAVAAIVNDRAPDGEAPHIGEVALACALGYLDLRYPEFDWRSANAPLARWFHCWSRRESFVLTMPAVDKEKA